MSLAVPTEITDRDIAQAMTDHGGNFVKALAAAYLVADTDNQIRIKLAFREYWATYRRAAIAARRVRGEAVIDE